MDGEFEPTEQEIELLRDIRLVEAKGDSPTKIILQQFRASAKQMAAFLRGAVAA